MATRPRTTTSTSVTTITNIAGYSRTYFPPGGTTKLKATVIGGGGGGGGGAQSQGWNPFQGSTDTSAGGGGGGAGYAVVREWVATSNQTAGNEIPYAKWISLSEGHSGGGASVAFAGSGTSGGGGTTGGTSYIDTWKGSGTRDERIEASGGEGGSGGYAQNTDYNASHGGGGGNGGGKGGSGSKGGSSASGGSGGTNGTGYGTGGYGGSVTGHSSVNSGGSGASGAVIFEATVTKHETVIAVMNDVGGAISVDNINWKTEAIVSINNGGTSQVAYATPYSGYRFVKWIVVEETSNPTQTEYTDNPLRYYGNVYNPRTVYAVFEQYIYNVTYKYLRGDGTNNWDDYNSSQISSSYMTYNIDHGLTLPTPPNRANCHFDNGWQTDKYWSGDHTSTKVTQIPAGSTGDKTFYACWVGNKCKITLDYGTNDGKKTGWVSQDVDKRGIANASSLPDSPQYVEYNAYTSSGTTFNIPSMDTVAGSVYSLDAWYLGDSNTKATPTTGYTGGYNRNGVTLKARWYTTHVTINPNYQSDRYPGAGPGSSGIGVVEFNIKPMPENPSNYYDWTVWGGTPVCDTYDFQCWNTDRNGNGDAYYNVADPSTTPPHTNVMRIYKKQTTAINITLYAIWAPLYEVVIRMRVNGGYWGSDTQATEERVYYNSSIVQTRSIYLFSSTATQQHPYVLNPVNQSTPAYVNPAHADIVIQGTTYTIDFKGWDQNTTTGSPAYPYSGGVGSSLMVGAGSGAIPFGANRKIELVLYASWPNSREVRFTGNWPANESHTPILLTLNDNLVATLAETGVSSDLYWPQWTLPNGRLGFVDYEGNPTLPEAIFGTYLFKGWYTATTGGTKIDPNGPSGYFGDDASIYTQWVKQFHIVFSGNSIPNWESVIRVTDINYHVDPLPVIDNEDYIVLGWYTSPSGGDQITTTYAFPEDMTVYAHWIPVYKVTFDPNGGECTTSIGRTNGSYQLPSIPVPVRAGYLLDTNNGQNTGWYYADRPNVPILASTVFKRDTTVIAKWIAQSYTVTFDANGGQITIDPDSPESDWLAPITAGMRYNQIPNGGLKNGGRFPVPDTAPSGGYAFQGWAVNRYDVPATKYTLVSPNDIFTGEYTTLYAVWTKGSNIITFDALGGDVSPPRTYTNIDGTVTYYPTPRKTGSDFLGWYLWPIYYTANTMSDASTSQKVEEYYRDAIGAMPGDTVAHVQGTLLKSTTSPTGLQFRYNATTGLWVDVTDISFDTVYYKTEMTITLDSQGQSSELNNYWSSVNADGSWMKVDGTPTVTYTRNGNPFESLEQLVEYVLPSSDPDVGGGMPKNNDIAEVALNDDESLYYKFIIPYGLTIVLVREDELDDTAYTWRQKDNVTVSGVAVNGEWYNSTTDWNTVVLPGRVFDADTSLFAHWKDAVPPQVTGNICYIEKRLSRYADDVERIYIPNVTSIEDITTVSLTQVDTLMFGYENKYLSDLGTSRRLIVNVERPNPMPYNDSSSNPWEWSNGKWFKAFMDFTDYWQNYGRDTITGSMVGGFRFRYIPLSHDEDDDRVNFSDLYPEIDKNVFLTGNTEASFSGNLLKFTMNLAIGQMTSDSNTKGYEVLASDPDSDENKTVRLFVPEGVDLEVPQKPTTWTSPEGSMFKSWMGSDGNEYAPGTKVAFSTIANNDFKLEARWAFNHGCIILHRDQIYYYPPTLKSMISPNENISDDGDYTISFGNGDYYYAECTVIGGGGAGAGGNEVDELLTKDNEAVTVVLNFLIQDAAKELITKSYMEAGGAGGAGELVVRNITINPFDKLRCHVGRGGKILKESNYWSSRYDKYITGENGEQSYISHTRDDGETEMQKIPADGGYGGSGDSPYNGGAKFCAGGHGDVRNNPIDSTPGTTAATGQKGIPGTNGKDHDGGWQVVAGKQTVWFGGAGGGAAGLNTRFIVKDDEDESIEHVVGGGNNGDYYVSKGGNGANDGHSANGNSGQDPAFGGGGGSGCGGCTYKLGEIPIVGTVLIPIVTHYHDPGDGAPGLIVIQLSKRYS